jgi:hypothetical protein
MYSYAGLVAVLPWVPNRVYNSPLDYLAKGGSARLLPNRR